MRRNVLVDVGAVTVNVSQGQHLHGYIMAAPSGGVFEVLCAHGYARDQQSFPRNSNGAYEIVWPFPNHNFHGPDRMDVALSFAFAIAYELWLFLHDANCTNVAEVKHILYERDAPNEHYNELLGLMLT